MSRVVFVFLDGVGIGSADPAVNPVAAARIPALDSLLGDRPTASAVGDPGPGASLLALDATMGVPGLPQSGTGQAALLTGVNTARLLGRHFGPWTPTALRPLVAQRSVLARARAAGRRVAFANAYPEELFEDADHGPPAASRAGPPGGSAPDPNAVAAAGGAGPAPARSDAPSRRDPYVPRLRRVRPDPLRSGPALAALGAGVLERHTHHLERGDAVASEIVNDGWRRHLGRTGVPAITPADAGQNLARIAACHDLTLFAHFATDQVGHRGGFDDAVAALERVDAFLGALVDSLPAGMLLVVASDHGNIEDIRAGHTRNPAFGMLAGPGHAALAPRLREITDVAGVVLETLGRDLA